MSKSWVQSPTFYGISSSSTCHIYWHFQTSPTPLPENLLLLFIRAAEMKVCHLINFNSLARNLWIMYIGCQAWDKFCWHCCKDFGRIKVCPLKRKHRGAKEMEFQKKKKSVLSFFVASHCCGDLINPFSNSVLGHACFIYLVLELRKRCKPLCKPGSNPKLEWL